MSVEAARMERDMEMEVFPQERPKGLLARILGERVEKAAERYINARENQRVCFPALYDKTLLERGVRWVFDLKTEVESGAELQAVQITRPARKRMWSKIKGNLDYDVCSEKKDPGWTPEEREFYLAEADSVIERLQNPSGRKDVQKEYELWDESPYGFFREENVFGSAIEGAELYGLVENRGISQPSRTQEYSLNPRLRKSIESKTDEELAKEFMSIRGIGVKRAGELLYDMGRYATEEKLGVWYKQMRGRTGMKKAHESLDDWATKYVSSLPEEATGLPIEQAEYRKPSLEEAALGIVPDIRRKLGTSREEEIRCFDIYVPAKRQITSAKRKEPIKKYPLGQVTSARRGKTHEPYKGWFSWIDYRRVVPAAALLGFVVMPTDMPKDIKSELSKPVSIEYMMKNVNYNIPDGFSFSEVHSQQKQDAYIKHEIVWGDTLSGIAKKYFGGKNIQKYVDKIAEYNGIQDHPDKIYAGKTLKIPRI